MYKIYIDSADRYEKKVQLKKDKEIVAEKVGDLDIVVVIRDILSENSLDIEEIELVDVNRGPGSFTGLKIGVTVANTLNWILGRKSTRELDVPKYGSEPNIHETKWLEK